jgi:hypothetical protein
MKDAAEAFGSEVFVPLATIAIPGAIAIWPAIAWELANEQAFSQFIEKNPGISGFGLLVLAIAVGLLLEILGAFIEGWILDPLVAWKDSSFDDTWNGYLRLACKTVPIGQHYLTSRVMVLKFELGAGLALLFQGLGIQYYYDGRPHLLNLSVEHVYWTSYIAGILMLVSSFSTALLLHRTRANLLGTITTIGS